MAEKVKVVSDYGMIVAGQKISDKNPKPYSIRFDVGKPVEIDKELFEKFQKQKLPVKLVEEKKKGV